ncbi:MAG: sigma-70 family RNA polymerase sigma factor [Oscillospiraceae bacterium]
MQNIKSLSREQWVENNIGLVHSCAHKFKGRGIEYDDLFGAGCMGLVKAVDAFDTQRGVRFSTYAVPVILGEMRRLFRDGGTVKVSRSLKELSLKASRAREFFTAQNGREPTLSEISQILSVEEESLVEAISASTPPISLTVSEEDGGGQIESIEDGYIDLMSLKQGLAELEPKDQQIIILRYFKGKTQTQVAHRLGMTQVQVSRREKKILFSLREKLKE